MLNAFKVLVLVLIAFGMFYYPQEVLAAATHGIALWWRYVLPGLLPFFIISELLMRQGVVQFFGVMLEPLMRPLFRLPGKASFVIAMAHTAGPPIGAALVSQLRAEKELTREEGERLLAFTSNPSPGFMFGAVASGMLGRPGLGMVLAVSIYLANLLVGLIFRFYRAEPRTKTGYSKPSLKRAWAEMEKAQRADGRSFGQLLGDVINHSILTNLMVGGFITVFSVLIHLLQVFGVVGALSSLLYYAMGTAIPEETVSALIVSLFETTLGCQETIKAFDSLNGQVGGVAFVLGWGGLSVFAQVLSFTSKTDLRFSAFVIGRALHAFLALIISQVFLRFTNLATTTSAHLTPTGVEPWLNTWHYSSQLFTYAFVTLAALSLIVYLGQSLIRRL